MGLHTLKSPSLEHKHCNSLLQVQANKRCYSSVILDGKINLPSACTKYKFVDKYVVRYLALFESGPIDGN